MLIERIPLFRLLIVLSAIWRAFPRVSTGFCGRAPEWIVRLKVTIEPVSASRRPDASVVVPARSVYFQTCPKSGLVANSVVISPAGRLGNPVRAMASACCLVIFGIVDGVTVLKAPAIAVRIGSGVSDFVTIVPA